MELRWVVSASASALHAAAAMLRGQSLVEETLQENLAQPLEQFHQTCRAGGVDAIELADQLTAIAIEPASVADQVRTVLRKTSGEVAVNLLAADVTRSVHHLQQAFAELHPAALEELELRAAPLREQWEARGPGLMARLRKSLGADAIAETADVVLVQTVLGGGGVAHVARNRVTFEALLANPASELPEVVRLGWLLAQLQLDLPMIQGNLSRQRVLEVGRLALVPATLAAGHDVELTPPVEIVLPRALELWRLPSELNETVLSWWETFNSQRIEWGAALAALDQMI